MDAEDISLSLIIYAKKNKKKVDINLLMDKVEKKKREKKENHIYKFNYVSSISYRALHRFN